MQRDRPCMQHALASSSHVDPSSVQKDFLLVFRPNRKGSESPLVAWCLG